jgi:hypothetical protein
MLHIGQPVQDNDPVRLPVPIAGNGQVADAKWVAGAGVIVHVTIGGENKPHAGGLPEYGARGGAAGVGTVRQQRNAFGKSAETANGYRRPTRTGIDRPL